MHGIPSALLLRSHSKEAVMERNADDMFGATGNPSSQGPSSSPGSGATGMAGNTAPPAGLDFSTDAPNTGGAVRQTSKTDQAKATVQEKFGRVQDKGGG